jgi:hypothetical protein
MKGGKMHLSIRSTAFAAGALWGAAVLLTGLFNLVQSEYGTVFLQVLASIYPGYEASGSIADLIVGTLYALLDGLICGSVFAWLYNFFIKEPARAQDDIKQEVGVNYPTIEPKV